MTTPKWPTASRSGRQKIRIALTKFVDERATEAVDAVAEDPERAINATRDRAIVYLLAYSGVRGAEVFRHRNDSPRTGLRWRHVPLEENYLRVLAKKQEWDDRAPPDVVVPAIERVQKRSNRRVRTGRTSRASTDRLSRTASRRHSWAETYSPAAL